MMGIMMYQEAVGNHLSLVLWQQKVLSQALSPLQLQAHGQFYSTGYEFLLIDKAGFTTSQTAFGCPQDAGATITPLVISCRTCHCSGFQAMQMGRTIDNFCPLVSCIAPSDTVRISLQGGGFQVNTSSIPSSPVTNAFAVSGNGVIFMLWQATKSNGKSLYEGRG